MVLLLGRAPDRADPAAPPLPGAIPAAPAAPGAASPGAGATGQAAGPPALEFLGLNLVYAAVLVELYAGWQKSGNAALAGLGLLGGGVVLIAAGRF